MFNSGASHELAKGENMNLDKRCYDFPDCKNCPLNHTTICLVATHQMHLTFKGVIKNIKNDLRQIKKQEQEQEKGELK